LKKSLKILAIVAGGLIVLFILLAVGLTLFFDPNQYKGKIIDTVKNETGRELRIDGKLGWSFFPWIGIETGKLELGNAPGFGPEPFARIDAAGAKVELLPLLRKQVVVGTIFLDGLKLNLARNAAGKTNWDDLSKPSKTEKPPEKTTPGKEVSIGGISIRKIDISKADISWNDQSSGARYAVHNLDFKTGQIAVGRAVDVSLSFDLESGQPPVRARVDLTSRMALDLETQTLEVSELSLSTGNLGLLANFKGTRLFAAPAINGTLEMKPFNPRTLMDKLGVKYETADKNTLKMFAFKTKFAATADSVEFKDLALALDDSHVTGAMGIRHLARPAYQVDLAVDQIDLDRYLPASAPPTASGAKPDAAAPPAPVEIPLSMLRALAVQGRLRVQKLKAFSLHATDAVVQVSADNGLITLGPNQAKLYSGNYAGRTALDVRGKIPLLNIDESVSGIELAPALKDALQFDKFTGAANLSATLTAQGLDANRIKETLNGAAKFAVQNGSIKGVNLKKMSDAIAAAIRDKSYQKLTELVPQSGDETRFTQLGGTAQIKNGIVENKDLKLQSPDLFNVSGKGSANLPKETLDYTVTLGSYPLLIDGTFSHPRFKPDWNAIFKGKLEEMKSEKTKELEQKLDEKLKEKFKRFR